MKDKINQFAKGIFEYSKPEILLKPQELQISVDAGDCYQGSFIITNEKEQMMKGMVCTDCNALLLEEDAFHGVENEVPFTFCATYFSPAEVVKGMIRIVSDCGSILLPFTVTVNVPSCAVSTGKIRDLFHFANLARENVQEAINLFDNVHFPEVFLGQNPSYLELYQGLCRGENKGLAMEEFLIAIHKKVPVQISTPKYTLCYTECEETFMDRVTLHKDTWGYCEYYVQVDSDFIQLEQRRIRTTDFVGDTYELSFIVHPNRMREGDNYARLTVSNVRQTIQIEITAQKSGYQEDNFQQRIQEQEKVLQLYQNFLLFYQDRQTVKDYANVVERLTCTVDKISDNEKRYQWLLQLFRIHLNIVNHREEMTTVEMSQWEGQLEELFQSQPLMYSAYYYLLAIWKQDKEVLEECVRMIRECYRSREHHWLILWFLLQIDEEYQPARIRQEAMEEHFRDGCHSPLLYLEMCKMYNEAPDLLLELDAIRERCLHWGCRHDCMNEELQFRYTYLVSRQKNFSRILLSDLCLLYDRNPSDDLLTMICKMLMKDSRVFSEDLKWYALGIEKNLRITDLYEHYMYALEQLQEVTLPARVLLYFSFDNQLSALKKEMLYAYVIRHKEKDAASYESYYPAMKEYAFQQVLEGRINANLAVLYEEFITEETLNQQLANRLPSVLFAREITCYNADIVGVYVCHRQLQPEEFVPLIQGKAVVSVFTSDAQIFLADAKGNRYVQSIDYTSNRLLHLEYLSQKCLEYTGDDIRLLLHLYEKADSMNQSGDFVVELRKRVMEIKTLSTYYQKKVFAALIRYYFDNFEGELLDYHLEHMDWLQVDVSDRNQFVEYCAIRRCYDKAMEGIMDFGYEGIDAKRLLQISTKTFHLSLDEKKPQLVKLAWFIFQKGKFDENMIRYLCCYYNGSIFDMVQVWHAADGFGIDISDFSERILAQIVFMEEISPEAYEVFYKYYDKGLNKKLIRAFLKLIAYKYLVKGWVIPEDMFEYFYRDVRVEENRPCLLAALRYLSQKKVLTGEETIFADYNIHQLYEKNIIFGFYKDYYQKVSLPDQVLKEQYLEYTANPGNEVKIHYLIASKGAGEEYTTETMQNVFEGIHVKSFVLFQDEILQYYISEITPDGEEHIMESLSVRCDERISDVDGGNWYHMLNLMMIAQEMNDNTTLVDVMQEYAEKREIAKQLIKPLKG